MADPREFVDWPRSCVTWITQIGRHIRYSLYYPQARPLNTWE